MREDSSFRDPSSFIVYKGDKIFRYLHKSYIDHYDHLMISGLYKRLCEENLILSHEEIDSVEYNDFPKVIIPEKILFITYPYEWSFSQFKNAALLTLKIIKISLEYGMILKDSSAYNIQFVGSKPVFIDTSSFEKYEEGAIWKGYKQFLRHFLAPLALSSFVDVRLTTLLIANLDGIDLNFARKILPVTAFANLGLFTHLFMNSFESKTKTRKEYKINKNTLNSILVHLEETIFNFKIKNKKSEWGNYYDVSNSTDNTGQSEKSKIVETYIKKLNCKTALDIGANDGRFSILLSNRSIYTLSTDIDELAVEKNYLNALKGVNNYLQTLHLNFANPSPAIGWDNCERKSFFSRARFDLVLALALIHHLVITYDLTFEMVAEKLSKVCNYLIIEFPTPQDEKVEIISKNKKSQFLNYNINNFKCSFEKYFVELDNSCIESNKRIVFLYAKKA